MAIKFLLQLHFMTLLLIMVRSQKLLRTLYHVHVADMMEQEYVTTNNLSTYHRTADTTHLRDFF